MAESILIESITKNGQEITLHLPNGTKMVWPNLQSLIRFVRREKDSDHFLRAVIRKIRQADPDLTNLGAIVNRTFTRGDVV